MTSMSTTARPLPPSRPPTYHGLAAVAGAAGAAVAVLGAVLLLVALSWPQRDAIDSFQQPVTVQYDDGSVHYATRWRIHSPAAPVGLGDDHHVMVLGSDPSGAYGHPVRFAALGSEPTELTVRWAPEGAFIDYGSGHRVFVPARWFTGGR